MRSLRPATSIVGSDCRVQGVVSQVERTVGAVRAVVKLRKASCSTAEPVCEKWKHSVESQDVLVCEAALLQSVEGLQFLFDIAGWSRGRLTTTNVQGSRDQKRALLWLFPTAFSHVLCASFTICSLHNPPSWEELVGICWLLAQLVS